MPAVTRIGDIAVGICCCGGCPPYCPCIPWVGVYISGAGTVNAEGSPDSRIGDVVVGCHPQVAVGGSPTVNSEGSPTTRIGDGTAGCTVGVNVTGAGTVFADDQ